jgi:cation transport ATPase
MIKILRYSKRFMIFNLIWALAYNIFILPVSAGIFRSEGLIISPMVASAAMSGSDLMILFISNLM